MKTWIKKNWVSLVVIVLMSLLSIFVGFYETDVQHRNYNVPYAYSSDGMTKYILVKSFQENGIAGAYFMDRIGAPGQSTQIAIPNNDPLLIVRMFILSKIMPSITATLFAYYIMTFFWTSLAMYWLMRKLKVNPILAGVLGLLFTCTPYHFMKSVIQLTLVSLFTIPLGIAIAIYMYQEAWKPTEKPVFKKWEIAACAIICGLSSTYYVFFLMMMYAISFLLNVVTNYKEFKKFKSAFNYCKSMLWAPILMVLAVASSQVPRIIYCRIHHIVNPMTRSPYESELYSLKLTQLFLPVEYHNIKAFRDFTNAYWEGIYVKSECMTLGLIAGIGIIAAFVFFFILYGNGHKKSSLYKLFSNVVIWYILIGAAGGVGLLFNMLVTPQFRCYNRVSVVLCCIGYIIVGLLLQDLSKHKKKLAMTLTILALVAGIYDQVPIKPQTPYNTYYESLDVMYKDFFAEVENSLEPGSMVYQLPYIPYPEYPKVNGMRDYAHFKAYLYTDTIRWSYGGIKKIDTEAADLYINSGISYGFVERLYASGFSGVYLDKTGFADNWEPTYSFYCSFGVDPIVSRDGTLYFFNLESIMESIDDNFFESFMVACDVEVDESDLNGILDSLDDGCDVATDVIYDFIDDTEVVTYEPDAYVSFLYEHLLERIPSQDEITHWTDFLNEGYDYKGILHDIIASAEFTDSWLQSEEV